MKASERSKSPSGYAMAYGGLASGVVLALSFLEGSLSHERLIHQGAKTFIQYPYIYNVSTLADFALLNPVAIYFILKARNGFALAFAHFKKRGGISRFNQGGAIFVSIAVGFAAMCFYFKGFVGGTFFSESFAVGPNGAAVVSLTGWAIFAFTSAFMSLVVFTVLEFGNYTLFVRSLGSDDIAFALPPSISIDVKIAARPCLHILYVLATLFVVLSIFVFRDFYQFDIRESRRVWLFAPYIIACGFSFLPFWHLHCVMAEQKNNIIESNNTAIANAISDLADGEARIDRRIDPQKLAKAAGTIEKLQLFYESIPVWPVRASALMIPNMSLLVSATALAAKIADTLHLVGAH